MFAGFKLASLAKHRQGDRGTHRHGTLTDTSSFGQKKRLYLRKKNIGSRFRVLTLDEKPSHSDLIRDSAAWHFQFMSFARSILRADTDTNVSGHIDSIF